MTVVSVYRSFWSWAALIVALTLAAANFALHPASAQPTALGQGAQWYPVARPNVDSRSIVFDPKNPNIIYEGGGNGVFKSLDGGASWRTINNGLTNVNVNALAIDPVKTTKIYAGTTSGVFRSVDGGASWAAINSGIPDDIDFSGNSVGKPNILSLQVNPQNTSNLLAGSSRGLFSSSDYGETWVNAGANIGNAPVAAIAFSPSSPALVLALLNYGPIFKSLDAGLTWNESDSGLDFAPAYALAIDPLNRSRLFAGTDKGIYVSADSGATWALSSLGMPQDPSQVLPVYSLAIDPINHQKIWAGTSTQLFSSDDGGGTWTQSNAVTDSNEPLSIAALAISPASSRQLLIGTKQNGVFRTLDQGGTWSRVNSGPVLPTAAHAAVLFTKSNPKLVYTAGIEFQANSTLNRNLYVSNDRGKTWAGIESGPYKQSMSAFAIAPDSLSTLFAVTGENILESMDGGTSWQQLPVGISGEQVRGIIFDPQSPLKAYAFGPNNGIYSSMDGAQSWGQIYTGANVSSLSVSPFTSGVIYAGALGAPIIRSTDDGITWTIIGQDIASISSVLTIVFDQSSNSIFAGGVGGLYRSDDGGNSWARSDNGIAANSVYQLVQDSTQPKTIYAATDAGIFRSLDGGSAWTIFGQGIAKYTSMSSVSISPSNPSILYAGASNRNLYTTDPAANGVPTPASGWWWNPAEPGRGYGLEVSATGAARLGLFGFDDSGFSHWWTASGMLDAAGNFSSNLIDAEFGNPLGAPQRAAKTASVGSISFAATSDTAGTLTLPNGSQVPIQRYNFTPAGTVLSAGNMPPKAGWWSSPDAPGLSIFLEIQNGILNASVLSFDVDGAPTWYNTVSDRFFRSAYAVTWNEFIGGQTLSGPYRAPKALAGGPAGNFEFYSPTSGMMHFGNIALNISWTGP